MNLNKIEIQGFKSFPDKTEINFDTDITGIVGPNGCGKSNVVDAVRWVLGEQKSSSLRISKNIDLIFGGTKNRRSQSYCEVSIYLDNSKNIYPIEFEDLVITRKLDRSGDSSSYINGQRCNLKDVVNLFRDTGIGKEGYSIIGQGKINSIMSSKPDARREIFEEAAGISKHKDRKNSSENKLVRTRDNMSRLNDIMKELEQNLGPLKQESEQAAEVKKIRKELKIGEVELFLYQSENSELTRVQTDEKLKEITKIYQDNLSELRKLNEDYNKTLKQIAELDTISDDLHANILSLTISAQKAIGKSENLALSIKFKQEEKQKKSTEFQNNILKLEARAGDIVSKINLKTDKETQYFDLKNQYLESKAIYDEIRKSVEMQEKEIEISKDLLFDNISKRAEIDKNRATYELELKLLQKNVDEYQPILADKKRLLFENENNRKIFFSQIENLVSEKKNKLFEKNAAEINFQNLKNELVEAENNKIDLITRKSNLKFKLATIKENIESYASYDAAVQSLMEFAKDDKNIASMIIGTFAEIITVPKQYVTAIETALGNALQNIVTPDEYMASFLIDTLKQNSLGRATFLPLTTVKAYPLSKEFERCFSEPGVIGCAADIIKYDRKYFSIVSSFLGKTVVTEDKDVAIKIAKKYNYAFKIVTLEGEAFLPSGAISGGSAKYRTSKILSQETEYLDNENKLRKAEKDFNIVSGLVDELKSEKDKINLALNVIDARINQVDKELIDINAKNNNVSEKLLLTKEDSEKVSISLNSSQKRIAELEEMLYSSSQYSLVAQNEKISADDFINEAKEKYYKDKETSDKLNGSITDLLVRINTLESFIKNIDSEIIDFKSEYRHIESKQVDLDVEIRVLNAEINNLQKDVDISEFPEEEKNKLQKANLELGSIDIVKKEKNLYLTDLESKRTIQNDNLNDSNEKKIREESKLEKINLEIDNMASRMYETYSFNFQSANEYWVSEGFGDIPTKCDVQKSLEKIMKLRRRIEKFGPINELAEERYALENVRFEEMTRHFEDLSKAEQDLVKIIADLTAEMETKFIESFKQISVNFNDTFKELFGGGLGQLSLEKGLSPLLAGIKINAQPPGKLLKSIELLSGGEETLTAIAILFAINKLSPMPFSLLDEIDASLDESNARLFAQYFSRFSKDTQFIVITHRKPTMSLCDVLYGVTMQEKGISKVVKVKLEEAETH